MTRSECDREVTSTSSGNLGGPHEICVPELKRFTVWRATSHKTTTPANNNKQVNVYEISVSLRQSISLAVKCS